MNQPTSSNAEEWLPIPGYEGLYSVSDHGRVWSHGRKVMRKNGVPYNRKPAMLKPRGGQKYASVMLYGQDGNTVTRRVHRLVMEAFIGPCPPGLEVRHYDDNPRNNNIENLLYGDRSANMRDAVRNGVHPGVRKTHCVNGHPFTPENTAPRNGGRGRSCRACASISGRKVYERQMERVAGGYRAAPRYGGECQNGHSFDEGNTYFYANGNRECKTCRRDRDRERRAKAKK